MTLGEITTEVVKALVVLVTAWTFKTGRAIAGHGPRIVALEGSASDLSRMVEADALEERLADLSAKEKAAFEVADEAQRQRDAARVRRIAVIDARLALIDRQVAHMQGRIGVTGAGGSPIEDRGTDA